MSLVDVAVTTPRLDLAPWRADDAAAGLSIYGDPEVARWLSPAVDPIKDEQAMRETIERWIEMDAEAEPPTDTGRCGAASTASSSAR